MQVTNRLGCRPFGRKINICRVGPTEDRVLWGASGTGGGKHRAAPEKRLCKDSSVRT
jgi:hypothetical protein